MDVVLRGAIDFEPALAWEYSSALLPELELVHSHVTRSAGLEDLSGPGNVVAYNCGDVMWERSYPNTTWLMADLSANHCAHPFMNLFEGNVGTQLSADDIHGSSSHQTFLRGMTRWDDAITQARASRRWRPESHGGDACLRARRSHARLVHAARARCLR